MGLTDSAVAAVFYCSSVDLWADLCVSLWLTIYLCYAAMATFHRIVAV